MFLEKIRHHFNSLWFKSILVIAVISFALSMGTAASKNPNVLAVVGNSEIYASELDQYNEIVRQYEPFMAKMNEKQREEFTASLQKQILFRIINDKLILQEAKKNGIAISDGIIKSVLEKNPQLVKKDATKANLAILVEEIKNNIMNRLLIDLLKEAQINSDMLIQKLAEAKSAKRELVEVSVDLTKIQAPDVTKEEIKSYYEQNKDKFKTQELRAFSYVTIIAKDTNSFKDTHNLINKLEDELAAGATLLELQKKFNLEIQRVELTSPQQFKGDQEIIDFAFGPDTSPNARFIQFNNHPGYFAVSIEKTKAPEQIALNEVQADITKDIKSQKIYNIALAKAYTLLGEFKANPNKIFQSNEVKFTTSTITLEDARFKDAAIADYILYENTPSGVIQEVNAAPGFVFVKKITYKNLDQNSLEMVKKQTGTYFLDIIYSQFLEYLKNRHKIILY